MDQYLSAVRQLDDYSKVNFPECNFVCNEDRGLVKASFNFHEVTFKLVKNGSKKEKVLSIPWNQVQSSKTVAECQNFSITFLLEDTTMEIRIGTFFVSSYGNCWVGNNHSCFSDTVHVGCDRENTNRAIQSRSLTKEHDKVLILKVTCIIL